MPRSERIGVRPLPGGDNRPLHVPRGGVLRWRMTIYYEYEYFDVDDGWTAQSLLCIRNAGGGYMLLSVRVLLLREKKMMS